MSILLQRQTRRKARNLSNKSVDASDLDLKSSSDTEAVRRRSKTKKEAKVNKEEEDINKSPERVSLCSNQPRFIYKSCFLKASADESDNQNSTSSNGSSGSTGTTVNSNSNNNARTKCSVCGKEFGKVKTNQD